MSRSISVAKEHIERVKLALKRHGFHSQRQFEEEKFLNVVESLYLPTYLPTYWVPICVPTYLTTYIRTYLSTYLRTRYLYAYLPL